MHGLRRILVPTSRETQGTERVVGRDGMAFDTVGKTLLPEHGKLGVKVPV